MVPCRVAASTVDERTGRPVNPRVNAGALSWSAAQLVC